MRTWSLDDIDAFLDQILPADNQMLYERKLVEFGCNYGRGARMSIEEGDQMLRRRANRCIDYPGPANPTHQRHPRTGKPFTWTENRVLDWGLHPNKSESKKPVTVEYLAMVLARSAAEVAAYIEQQQNTKMGIEGFDI